MPDARRCSVISAAILAGTLCQCQRHAGPTVVHTDGATAAAPRASSSSTTGDAAAPPLERHLALRDGRTAVVGPEDHVVILAADGGEEAESYCGVNGISYSRAVSFFVHAIELVEKSDKAALAELVTFPLQSSPSVKTRAQFLARYGELFPPPEVAAIIGADPGAIFCRNGAFMLGDGELWAAPDDHGEYRLTAVNPSVRKTKR